VVMLWVTGCGTRSCVGGVMGEWIILDGSIFVVRGGHDCSTRRWRVRVQLKINVEFCHALGLHFKMISDEIMCLN
jgi:hypothetical protein